jgi:hypothetical protein
MLHTRLTQLDSYLGALASDDGMPEPPSNEVGGEPAVDAAA